MDAIAGDWAAEDAARAERVLVYAPVGRDAPLLLDVLAQAGLEAVACAEIGELADAIALGAGAAVLAHVGPADAVGQLERVLASQPPWSELPVLQFTGASENRLSATCNVTTLERPIRMETLVSAVRAALRARRRQYEVRRLVQRLQDADRLKDEFLAIVSHELRTPLNAIVGWTSMLRSASGGPDALERGLTTIERNSRVLTHLVEDLLDVSRAVTGKLQVKLEPVDLEGVVLVARDSMREAAGAKRIAVELHLAPGGAIVAGDPQRLGQVVWNLVHNSVKFTNPGGRIAIRLERRGADAAIIVEDDGIGIPPSYLPRIFERFSQADGSSTRRHGGLGLGLAIVRHLIELQGGSVHAESAGDGLGSRFTVLLPLIAAASALAAEVPAEQDADAAPAAQLDGLRVLVVDDEPDMRELLQCALTGFGAEVRTAASAAAALAELDRFTADVLVSDIGMPEEDGYALIRAVRDRLPDLPAIALSAYAREQDRWRALAAGYQDYVRKPAAPAAIAALIERMGRRS